MSLQYYFFNIYLLQSDVSLLTGSPETRYQRLSGHNPSHDVDSLTNAAPLMEGRLKRICKAYIFGHISINTIHMWQILFCLILMKGAALIKGSTPWEGM
jgi:hypothetical protein